MADNEDLVNALAALTASIRLQNDNHADATLHHTHRQNALENLVARLAANTRTDVERIPRFSGSAHEDVSCWIDKIDRMAADENWDDDEKRLLAIRRLSGAAFDWHGRTGHEHDEWNEWSDGLRGAFQQRLSLSEWSILMERRVQAPGESGVHYALEKSKLCSRCPLQLTDQQLVHHLIRGLAKPEHVAAMMRPPPDTLAEFITTIGQLEEIGGAAIQPKPAAIPTANPVVSTVAGDNLDLLVQTLTDRVTEGVLRKLDDANPQRGPSRPTPYYGPSYATLGYGRPAYTTAGYGKPSYAMPGYVAPRPTMSGGYRQQGYYGPPSPQWQQRTRDFSNVECFGCHRLGHLRRDCPELRVAFNLPPPTDQSGNGVTAQQGRGQSQDMPHSTRQCPPFP